MQDKKILPKVEIEDHRLELMQDRILAMAVIDDAEECTIFSINQTDFEIWCDKHDLRDYCDGYTSTIGTWIEDSGTFTWEFIYANRIELKKLIKLYIEDLYIQETFDIQTSLKNF